MLILFPMACANLAEWEQPGFPTAHDGSTAEDHPTWTVRHDTGESGAWYPDRDGDGYGAVDATPRSYGGLGYAERGGDCQDHNALVSPDRDEICDGLDNDCDGFIDDDDQSLVDPTVWYLDKDGDGHAGAQAVGRCEAPAGADVHPTDCDDDDSGIHPGAIEVLDGVDEDCDGLIDDGAELPERCDLWAESGLTTLLCRDELLTWQNAHAACAWYGYELAVPTSEGDSLALAALLDGWDEDHRVWLGLTDADAEGRWLTTDGANAPYVDQALVDENTDDHDCVVLHHDDGEWVLARCEHTRPYACEALR